ncbi:Arc family DNA-binding protein [Rhizobium sp. P007]|uniref:Arc family DNA-binding protein n=1 Tax=Rhizobium sp. P007 TaxID=285908 RepID=UPI00115C2C84|nr:Arc family DNA-binding protein [Rhizobium sp. P007]
MAEDQNRAFQDKFMLRFPDGMRDEIKHSAEESGRSMNAEIIQRLKSSLEDDRHDYYRVSLPEETRNALSIDALVHNVDLEERASQVLQAAFDKSSEYTFSLLKVDELAREGAFLEAEVRRLEETQNVDFLLYYSKATQLSHLSRLVAALGEAVPDHIREMAQDYAELSAAELRTLRQRHEQISYFKRMEDKLQDRAETLEREIAENENSDDDSE